MANNFQSSLYMYYMYSIQWNLVISNPVKGWENVEIKSKVGVLSIALTLRKLGVRDSLNLTKEER